MIMKFSDALMKEYGNDVFQYVEDSSWSQLVKYVIDRRYRTSVVLKKWLKELVDNPSEIVKSVTRLIPDSINYDTQMRYVFNWVKRNITYQKDEDSEYDVYEYWKTPHETLITNKGDCEDGAILMYVLARMKGIPSNRLYLMCGRVKDGSKSFGHCWLAYKPKNYPLNYVFMDWCFHPTKHTIQARNKFFIKEQSIFEEFKKGHYDKLWFAFNENWNAKSIKRKQL